MPRKPPIVFPQEQRLLSELGERLRLARKRRKLSNTVVAQRAGISRSTVYKVEAGDAGATLGARVTRFDLINSSPGNPGTLCHYCIAQLASFASTAQPFA